MTRFVFKGAIAASLAVLAIAPVAAQDIAIVDYGDLDIASAEGSAALEHRVELAIADVCQRPEMRDLSAMRTWQECKRAAHADAAEQLARSGVSL